MLFVTILLLVSVQSMHSASVSKEKALNMDMIRFPIEDNMERDDLTPAKLQAPLKNKFGDGDVHESCKNQTFCTIMPPDYPEEKFNEMFKGYKIPPMPTVDVLGNRQGDPSYSNGCETMVTFEPVYKVRPKRDKDAWRTVVQAPAHNFIQRIRLETCMSTGSSCFKPLVEFSVTYETACVQMDTVWDIMVETLDGKGTEKIQADLPTCCSCKYKEIDLTANRFGVTPALNKTKV